MHVGLSLCNACFDSSSIPPRSRQRRAACGILCHPNNARRSEELMKVMIIGGGGREHALAWKAAQSPREAKVENGAIAAEAIDELVQFARDNAIALTIVGPEAPLVRGVVDRFRAAQLRCFGPTQAAAQLEGSKAFAKDFLARHGIPT